MNFIIFEEKSADKLYYLYMIEINIGLESFLIHAVVCSSQKTPSLFSKFPS